MSKNQKNTTQKLGSTEAEKNLPKDDIVKNGNENVEDVGVTPEETEKGNEKKENNLEEEKVKKEAEVIEKQKQKELQKKKEEKKKEEQKKGETEKKTTGKTKIKLVCDVLYGKGKRKKGEVLELESEELSKFSKSFYELV